MEPNSPSAPKPATESLDELRDRVRGLRGLLYFILVALILLASSLFILLYKQNSTLTYQIGELTRGVETMEQSLATAEQFLVELDRFAEQDPNFRPIFNRHFNRGRATRAGMELSPTNDPPNLIEPPK